MPALHLLSANYVSGGTRSGDVVTWSVASLAADSSTSVRLVVTATQTITNNARRATVGGNLSAMGEAPTVTFVGQPVTGKPYYYFGRQRVAMRKGAEVYYLHGEPDTDSTPAGCTDRRARVPCDPRSPCPPP